MAMDKTVMATAIVAEIEAKNPEVTGANKTLLIQRWECICKAIIEHIQGNADIVLSEGDVKVLPGTFLDSLNDPITGKGDNESVTLSTKIQ